MKKPRMENVPQTIGITYADVKSLVDDQDSQVAGFIYFVEDIRGFESIFKEPIWHEIITATKQNDSRVRAYVVYLGTSNGYTDEERFAFNYRILHIENNSNNL